MKMSFAFLNELLTQDTSEDITRSATAIITNSIIAIVLTRGANIRDTPGNPEDRKIGWN